MSIRIKAEGKLVELIKRSLSKDYSEQIQNIDRIELGDLSSYSTRALFWISLRYDVEVEAAIAKAKTNDLYAQLVLMQNDPEKIFYFIKSCESLLPGEVREFVEQKIDLLLEYELDDSEEAVVRDFIIRNGLRHLTNDLDALRDDTKAFARHYDQFALNQKLFDALLYVYQKYNLKFPVDDIVICESVFELCSLKYFDSLIEKKIRKLARAILTERKDLGLIPSALKVVEVVDEDFLFFYLKNCYSPFDFKSIRLILEKLDSIDLDVAQNCVNEVMESFKIYKDLSIIPENNYEYCGIVFDFLKEYMEIKCNVSTCAYSVVFAKDKNDLSNADFSVLKSEVLNIVQKRIKKDPYVSKFVAKVLSLGVELEDRVWEYFITEGFTEISDSLLSHKKFSLIPVLYRTEGFMESVIDLVVARGDEGVKDGEYDYMLDTECLELLLYVVPFVKNGLNELFLRCVRPEGLKVLLTIVQRMSEFQEILNEEVLSEIVRMDFVSLLLSDSQDAEIVNLFLIKLCLINNTLVPYVKKACVNSSFKSFNGALLYLLLDDYDDSLITLCAYYIKNVALNSKELEDLYFLLKIGTIRDWKFKYALIVSEIKKYLVSLSYEVIEGIVYEDKTKVDGAKIVNVLLRNLYVWLESDMVLSGIILNNEPLFTPTLEITQGSLGKYYLIHVCLNGTCRIFKYVDIRL